MSRPATALKSQTRREVVDLVAPYFHLPTMTIEGAIQAYLQEQKERE